MDDPMIQEEIDNIIEDWLIDAPFEGAYNPFRDNESSSDDSDGDELPNDGRRTCIQNYIENTVHAYSNEQFRSHFRLERPTVYNSIDRLQGTDFLNPREPIDVQITHEKAFLLTLWYLGNLETFRQIADRFDLSRSSAHKVLLNTLAFINSLSDEYIRWPATIEEKEHLNREFARLRNIVGVIGAIDGCHVQIKKPRMHQEDYYNRKKFHSVVLQGTVTSEKLFIDVHIGEPGSMHDARILRRSPLYVIATEDPEFFGNYYLLGDSAYPQLPWLLPPFRHNGHLNEQQRLFNYRHSATRIKVEHAFGLLKARFRRLIRLDNFRLEIIIDCIMAACVLHNICILANDDLDVESDSSNYEL